MWCYVERTSGCVGQRHDIHWIEMLPTDHPSQAFGQIGWEIIILQYVNVVRVQGVLFPGMICDHVRIVQS